VGGEAKAGSVVEPGLEPAEQGERYVSHVIRPARHLSMSALARQ
jgi:hypothetical protein